jgi:hypothetical protein
MLVGGTGQWTKHAFRPALARNAVKKTVAAPSARLARQETSASAMCRAIPASAIRCARPTLAASSTVADKHAGACAPTLTPDMVSRHVPPTPGPRVEVSCWPACQRRLALASCVERQLLGFPRPVIPRRCSHALAAVQTASHAARMPSPSSAGPASSLGRRDENICSPGVRGPIPVKAIRAGL